MAKYKYDVYEVEKSNELVYQNVTNTDSVNVRNGCDEYTPDLENKIFKRGIKFGGISSIPNGYFVCARRYNGRWTVFLSGNSTEEYCFKEESRGRKLYRIETVEKQGKLIESIVADENAYPTNGIKDGKWYVRKEIIQEHKISLKDSEGKLINIASIYFKDSNSNISNIAKAYSDKELLWEKNEDTIVYSESGKSSYDININSWTKIQPDTNYKFVTNRADNEYSIVAGNTVRKIKNNDVFKCKNSVVVKIRNTDYNYFDIKLIKTKEPASVIL